VAFGFRAGSVCDLSAHIFFGLCTDSWQDIALAAAIGSEQLGLVVGASVIWFVVRVKYIPHFGLLVWKVSPAPAIISKAAGPFHTEHEDPERQQSHAK
jgi:hypothetical protein